MYTSVVLRMAKLRLGVRKLINNKNAAQKAAQYSDGWHVKLSYTKIKAAQ